MRALADLRGWRRFAAFHPPLGAVAAAPLGFTPSGPPTVGARAAADVLPFRFMLGFPVEALVGLLARHDALYALAAQWGYVVLFGAAAVGVWRVGVRHFSAYGG